MSTRATTKLDTAVRASLALGFAIAVSAVADASEVPIYKCIQADGGVLYTDALCKGVALLDIRFRAPDPAANNRLERAQAALERSAPRWGWFPLFVQPRFRRPQPPELPMQPRFAPNPPFIVPRH